MSIERFNRAKSVMTKLQSCDDFEHFGRNSRGIKIQTESLVEGIARLAVEYPQAPLILMGSLIRMVSIPYGTYVRVKGGNEWIGLDVRGDTGPVHENMSLGEISEAFLRRSGVNVDFFSDGRSGIYAHSDFLEIGSRSIADVINVGLKRLPDDKRVELAGKFVDIVAQEIAISGEFLDL